MTATDFDFINTRNEIINAALRKCGALAPGESPDVNVLDNAIACLNQIVQSWATDHIFLWSQSVKSQTITATNASYALPSDPPIVGITRASYRTTSTGEDTKIQVVRWSYYFDIVDKAETGEPELIALSIDESKMYFWPVPDTTYYVKYLAIEKLKDWDSASSTGDIPVAFQRALIYQLACDMGDELGVDVSKLEAKAAYLFQKAKAGDKEFTSYEFMTPAFKV